MRTLQPLHAIACFALALAAGLIACAKVDYIPLNAAPHAMAPRPPEKVAMFQTVLPDRPYVEVANIEVQSASDAASVMDRLRQEAGEHGCEGLILIGTKDSTTITANRNMVTSTQNTGFRATCIVFKDSPPAAATP